MRRREFITLLGGATAWPLAARAQQPAMPVIGFLSGNNAERLPQFTAAFHEGLSAAGFVDGKNVAIEYRWADSHLERVPALALDLIRRRVTVIFASGGDVTTFVAKGATATIPIVFVTGSDPVAMGFVASLNRPGGNVTGATFIASELGPKRVSYCTNCCRKLLSSGCSLIRMFRMPTLTRRLHRQRLVRSGCRPMFCVPAAIRKLIPPSPRWSN